MTLTPQQLYECHKWIQLDTLDYLPGNPNQGHTESLQASIDELGWIDGIVVHANTIIAGNHRVEEARAAGETHLPGYDLAIHLPELDDARRMAMALAHNRTTRLGGDDPRLMLAAVGEMPDELLASMMLDAGDIADLQLEAEALNAADAAPEPGAGDDAADLPEDPVTVLGDVWLCGEHRVVCGDSTDAAVLALAVNGLEVRTVWTDPPYGVAYEGGSLKRDAIENDALSHDDLRVLLLASFGQALEACRPGATWWVTGPPGPESVVFGSTLHALGIYRQCLVWVKNNATFNRTDYHYQHENIWYGWSPDARHYGPQDRKQTSVLEFDRPQRSDAHPTMKPVDLIRYCLSHSMPGLVLDMFGGSGSTMIAAHREGRTSSLVELDPRYVDGICARWQTETGEKPVRLSDGMSVDFLTP